MLRIALLLSFVSCVSGDENNSAAKKSSGGASFARLSKDGKVNCRHGVFDEVNKRCICDKGWETAHITDTIDFLEGVCEQYQCESDAKCAQNLDIPWATCPVQGWNCYCGFNDYAFANFGHGYEIKDAECMGFMYALSVSMEETLRNVLVSAWRYFLYVSLAFVLFGRRRTICDHHSHTLWTVTRKLVFGTESTCPGDCHREVEYGFSWKGLETIMDDFAWSVYFIDLGIWFYVFTVTAYFVFLFCWSVVLWAIVIVLLICGCIAMMCMALAGCEGGGGGSCDMPSCDCCAGFGDVGGVDMAAGGVGGADVAAADSTFMYGGPYPYDPMWGFSNSGAWGPTYGSSSRYGGRHEDDCCGCSKCCEFACRPLCVLCTLLPHVPENAHGGVLGYIMGTHARNETYTGGSGFVDFLGMRWRRRADLHDLSVPGQARWQEDVARYVRGPSGAHTPPVSQQMGAGQHVRTLQRDGIRGVRAVQVQRPFDKERDSVVDSSWEDYTTGVCWICRDEPPPEDWDLWLSCRHIFCTDCSSQMLQRRMPCPLCRVASATVLRGQRHGAPANAADET